MTASRLISEFGIRMSESAGDELMGSMIGIADGETWRAACLDEERTRTSNEAVRLAVIKLVSGLPRSTSAEVLGRQVLRSGTSIGANYREANRAASRNDFIHKLSICEKEAAETEYWLELLRESGLTARDTDALLREAGELLAIFVASGRTAKRSS